LDVLEKVVEFFPPKLWPPWPRMTPAAINSVSVLGGKGEGC